MKTQQGKEEWPGRMEERITFYIRHHWYQAVHNEVMLRSFVHAGALLLESSCTLLLIFLKCSFPMLWTTFLQWYQTNRLHPFLSDYELKNYKGRAFWKRTKHALNPCCSVITDQTEDLKMPPLPYFMSCIHIWKKYSGITSQTFDLHFSLFSQVHVTRERSVHIRGSSDCWCWFAEGLFTSSWMVLHTFICPLIQNQPYT